MGETGPHNTTSPRHPDALNTKQKYVLKRPYLSPTTVFPAAAECMSAKGGPLGLASVPPDIKLFLTLPSLTTLLKLQSPCSHYGLIFLLVDKATTFLFRVRQRERHNSSSSQRCSVNCVVSRVKKWRRPLHFSSCTWVFTNGTTSETTLLIERGRGLILSVILKKDINLDKGFKYIFFFFLILRNASVKLKCSGVQFYVQYCK